MFKDRRLWIIVFLLAAVATSFWTSSRYPSLDVKSSMSGAVALQDSLSFEAVFNTSTAPNIITQIAYTFGNWVYINWEGMAFGLVLAVLLLTALPLLRDSYSRNRFGSTFLGSMIGVPLGLCVNCSAPVAYGIYRGGGRAETALAAMLSSPALNVVVLGMSIALLPAYLWATKLGLSLLLIFAFVPLLVKFTHKESINTSGFELNEETDTSPALKVCDSISEAILWLIPTLLKNAFDMLWKMLPLMLLAGLLGAIMVTVLPWEKLIDLLPMHNVPLIIAAMCLLALFTLILPVPVAFDIILVATLVSAGLPDRYAGIMLFALGSFSVYSFMVLIKAKMKSVAISLCICVWLISIVAGALSHYWGLWDANNQKQLWFEVVKSSKGSEYQAPVLDYKDLAEIEAAPALSSNLLANQPAISETKLGSAPQNQNSLDQEAGSWKMQKKELGLQNDTPPVFWSNMAPYSAFAPLAATDINQDGWPDLIKGGYSGIQIYINTGGQFQLVRTPALSHLKRVSVLAPADLDNDGDPDLVIVLFSGERYLSYSENGQFQQPIQITEKSISYTPALAIADIDQNGELDLLFGNQTVLDLLNISTIDSLNTLYMQHNSEFIETPMPVEQGSTLSILISDIDDNQRPDIFIGNDFDTPDRYYEYHNGHQKSTDAFKPWSIKDILETTRTTMSIDTADIDNDLALEAYIAQISMESPNTELLDVKRQSSVYERNYSRLLYGYSNPFGNLTSQAIAACESTDMQCTARNARARISAAIRARDISKCNTLPENQVWQCAAVAAHEFTYRRGRFTNLDIPCENLGAGYPEISVICERMSEKNKLRESSHYNVENLQNTFPQNSLTNILLHASSQQDNLPKYIDIAESMGIQYSGWTWNAKFADLDGDQWQDLFIANGWYQMRTDTSNVFFRNIEGKKFKIETQSAGLIDYEPTKSYVYLDLDQDGDLDLITHNIYGELNSYINQNKNNHIQFEIEDSSGNKSAIGAKVIIEYGKDQELHQIRELKLSGGYQSFDPVIAHFGLGEHQSVSKVRIQLPSGQIKKYTANFKHSARYKVSIQE